MPEERLAELISAYLDGDIEERRRAELATALERDTIAAGEFDRALHLDALLRAAHVETPAPAQIIAGVRARYRPRRNMWIPAFAAAALLALVAGVWMGLREPAPPPVPRADNLVLSGSVLVDGRESKRISNGSRVQVSSGAPAVLRLADGSRARLSPESTATLHGPTGGVRQVVALEKGKGFFRVDRGARQFRVDTPVGKVTVTGTKFSVGLRPVLAKGERKMRGKLTLAMVVAVIAGSVSVEYDGKHHVLTVGQERVFAREGEKHRPKERGLPEVVRGFSGMVKGIVVAKGEKDTFTFKVIKVLKVWKGNKARKPHALAGHTVKVGPRWVKTDRGWRPYELHVAFIRKLRPKHVLPLEIVNHEGNHFSILELAGDQREWAKKGHREGEKHEGEKREGEKHEGKKREGEHREGEKREGEKREGEKDRPRRFVVSEGKATARLLGVVKKLKGSVLWVKVIKIKGQTSWKDPKHGVHEAKPGKYVGFGAQWELKRKGLNPKDGRNWQPSRHEMSIFRKLRPGDRVECGAYFDEHPRLRTVELVGRGEREHGEREHKHREGEKRDRDREHKHREGEKKEGEKKEKSGDWDF